MGGRGISYGATRTAIELPQKNADWLVRVGKRRHSELVEAVKRASNERERSYQERQLETWRRTVASTLDVELKKVDSILSGAIKTVVKEEAPQPRKTQPQAARTFVNAYGEATTRYVTSGTYERALKRTQKEIESRLKGR